MKSYYYKYGKPGESGLGTFGYTMLIFPLILVVVVIISSAVRHGDMFFHYSALMLLGGMSVVGLLLLAMDQLYKVGDIQRRVPTGYRIIEVRKPTWKEGYVEYAVQHRDAYHDWYDLSNYGNLLNEADTKKHPSTYKAYKDAEEFLKKHMKTHPVDIDYWEARKQGLDAVLRRTCIEEYNKNEKTLIEFT